MSAASTIAQRLATSASGYAVVKDGVLDIRTVTDTPNAAAWIGICAAGFNLFSNCVDPDCDCKLRALAQYVPSAKVVRVRIEVADD